MKYDTEIVGKMIKKEREQRGMTQAELASELGVSYKQISNYERGKLLPPLDNLLGFCNIFDCELGYLIGEEGYETKTKLMTKICELTGLSEESVQSISDLTNDEFHGDDNKHVLNKLLTADQFNYFIEDLIKIENLTTVCNNRSRELEEKYGLELLEEAVKVLLINSIKNPDGELWNNKDYQKQNPTISKILSDMYEMSFDGSKMVLDFNIARYNLNKTMELMIDRIYPLSTYKRE